MHITDREKDIFSKIEKEICLYFKIGIGDIVSRNTKNYVVIARNMLYYILHDDLKISIGKIAKRYSRTERGVKAQLSSLRFQIKNNCGYRDMHNSLMERMN